VQKDGGDFKREILADPQARKYLSSNEMEEIWRVEDHLKNVNLIFQRVFH
jgi:adenylosuccinate lyase